MTTTLAMSSGCSSTSGWNGRPLEFVEACNARRGRAPGKDVHHPDAGRVDLFSKSVCQSLEGMLSGGEVARVGPGFQADARVDEDDLPVRALQLRQKPLGQQQRAANICLVLPIKRAEGGAC